ncbi:MAG: lipopolysaccharide transport periplasmic protein LptA [Nitrospinae bacterium]|nr:lipopolysaccharide transport periplasmic protein LptA [Nitrospinota bacterium]
MLKKTILFSIICLSFLGQTTYAEENENIPINITSDRLISDNKSKLITFVGNVKATRDDMVINSDRIEIKRDDSGKGIDLIVARGNVKVNMNEKYATGEKAVYYEKEKKIVLTGNPRSWEGKNVIVGNEMIFFIDEDKVVVKQSKKKQVNVIFYPKEMK